MLIAGGSGLVGTRLTVLLEQIGYTVKHLTRTEKENNRHKTFLWNPEKNTIDHAALPWADHIVNLAGAGIADKKWTRKRKSEIIESRIKPVDLLLEKLNNEPNKVKSVVFVSAIGYYGNNTIEVFTEESPPGSGFLAETCVAWEKAINKPLKKEIRKSVFRIGLVLAKNGGALKEMLKPFALFLAVVFGNGKQIWSWIHIDDLCKMIITSIQKDEFSGVFNAVAPNPVSNTTLVKSIASVKSGYSFFFSLPAFILKLMLGERSEMLLNSQTVSAQKILDRDFCFSYPEIKPALIDLLDS